MSFENQSISHTVDRLCAEFDARFTRADVTRVLLRGVRDLAGSPAGALPELSERLARQRLLDAQSAARAVTAPRPRALAG
jgi:hypothetical protein